MKRGSERKRHINYIGIGIYNDCLLCCLFVLGPTVTGVKVGNVTRHSCTVSWDSVSSIPLFAPITGYTIYYRVSSSDVSTYSSVDVVDPGVTRYAIDRMKSQTSYTFEVSANNLFGNGVKSAPVNASTRTGHYNIATHSILHMSRHSLSHLCFFLPQHQLYLLGVDAPSVLLVVWVDRSVP